MVCSVLNIPSMNSPAVNAKLVEIGSSYEGRGVIVECGTWLGASMNHVSEGVGDRPAEFVCFDRFSPNQSEIEKAAQQGVELQSGEDTRPWIRENVISHMPSMQVVDLRRCDLINVSWSGRAIEIFILDAAKESPAFDRVIDVFASSLLPRAHVCFLDAYYEDRRGNAKQLEAMRKLCFSHEQVGSAAFGIR